MKVNVSHATYDALKVGDAMTLRSHPGAFGWEWIE